MYPVAACRGHRCSHVGSSDPSPADPLTNGLVVYYKLDEASGNAIDAHTNGYDLDDNNSVGADTGLLNGCRSFVRTSAKYLSRDTHVSGTKHSPEMSIDGAVDFLISCWIKPSSLAAPINIFGTFDDDYVYPLQMGYNSFTDNLALSVDTENYNCNANAVLTAGNWHHVLAWRSTASGKIGLLINNSVETLADMDGAAEVTSYVGNLGFYVGKALGINSWDGLIDEFAFWVGKTKTAAAAIALYNGGVPLSYESFAGTSF